MTNSNKNSRWADWEKNVLAKVGDVARLNEILNERRREVDDDSDESLIVRECIVRNMIAYGGVPNTGHYLIRVEVLAKWIVDVRQVKATPLKVTPYLKTLAIAELIAPKRRADGMCWIWRGTNHREGSTPQVLELRVPNFRS